MNAIVGSVLEPLDNIAVILNKVPVNDNGGMYLDETVVSEVVAQLREARHLVRELAGAYKAAVEQQDEAIAVFTRKLDAAKQSEMSQLTALFTKAAP